MAWIKIKGFEGIIWVPDRQPASERKHSCKDCDFCQQCSDTRCDACRKSKAASKKKR